MNWATIVAVLAAFAVFFLIKRAGQVSSKEALARLKAGALVIDVRSAPEFSSRHLPGAINLPLQKIQAPLPRIMKDKNQTLLLHCQSGMRSGVARKKLQALGYPNTFNLGSYRRAEEIIKSRQLR
jgi:phage shock protein E